MWLEDFSLGTKIAIFKKLCQETELVFFYKNRQRSPFLPPHARWQVVPILGQKNTLNRPKQLWLISMKLVLFVQLNLYNSLWHPCLKSRGIIYRNKLVPYPKTTFYEGFPVGGVLLGPSRPPLPVLHQPHRLVPHLWEKAEVKLWLSSGCNDVVKLGVCPRSHCSIIKNWGA